MGRLDNVIARNRRATGFDERRLVAFGMGIIILVILGLALFTNLGDPPAKLQAAPAAPVQPDHTRALGVELRSR